MGRFLGITADEDYGGLAMGYQAHCIVMEEISRASGLLLGLPITPYETDGSRQHWTLLCSPLPTLHQSALVEWHLGAERAVPSGANFR